MNNYIHMKNVMGLGILHLCSTVFLIVSFLIFKKTEKKLNFVKWLSISFISLYAYNIFIGMFLGILNITSYVWLLAIINIVIGFLLIFKNLKSKNFQKYEIRKIDIISLMVILIIFSVMFVKDLYIFKGDITHFAVDSAVHYRAAKHYAENLKIFINCEDKSFFNFNIMQTGAYINDGIFMNVINRILKIDHSYIYQLFETMTLFVGGFVFFGSFIDKIKSKRGLIGSLVLFALYIYGYPYNAWLYGFSYLAVGIAMIAGLLAIVDYLYSDENISKIFIISLVGLLGFGLIFSYCLFVPAIFAAICIYCFLKDLSSNDGKKILKIFKIKTLIVTGVLILVTFAGICYLFIPSFFIEGQTDLVSALKIGGGIYSEKYQNILIYIPFAIIYAGELLKRIKNKSLRYMDIFSICIVGYFALLYIGMLAKFVSDYYMLKIFSILWMVIFAVSIDILNEYDDWKVFRIDTVLLAMLYVIMLVKGISIGSITKIYFVLILSIYTVIPQMLKNVNIQNSKSKIVNKIASIKPVITSAAYVVCWGIFVCSWVWIKAGHILSEDKKHSLPNLVGIYYIENCEMRKLNDLTQDFNKNEVELVIFARENFKDMNVENLELMTEGYFQRIWATAMLEISSNDIPYTKIVQDTKLYKLKDALKDENKKYIVKLVSRDQAQIDTYKEELKEVKQNKNIEILMENENGYVARIN